MEMKNVICRQNFETCTYIVKILTLVVIVVVHVHQYDMGCMHVDRKIDSLELRTYRQFLKTFLTNIITNRAFLNRMKN